MDLAGHDTTARAALRAATAEAHLRLHGAAPFAALAAGSIGRRDYAALLGRLLGFHAPMEDAVAAVLPPGIGAWRRAALLRDDLAVAGAGASEIAALPRCAPPECMTPGQAMGALYVMEDSTLGGRHLAQGLDHLLHGPAGRSFLLAGTDPGRVRWRDVCAAIEAWGAIPQQRADMVAGAVSAFAAFEDWFTNPGRHP